MYFIRFSTPNRRGGSCGGKETCTSHYCLSWGQEGRFDGRRAGCGRGGDVRRTLYGSNTFPCLLSNTHACSGLVRVTFLFYVFLHFYFTVKTLRKNVSVFYRKISTPGYELTHPCGVLRRHDVSPLHDCVLKTLCDSMV